MTPATGEDASWATMEASLRGGGLTPEGQRAAHMVLQKLQQVLGPTWPRRQQAAFGGLPSELRSHAFHAAALPQFLSFALRLSAAVGEPTFRPVRSALGRGLSVTDWRHLLLQLEVARLGASVGAQAQFEPPISGTGRSADVLLWGMPQESPLMVEVTSLFRSAVDRQWRVYEEDLNMSLMEIEQRHGVFVQVNLACHLNSDDTLSWLKQVDAAAAHTRRTGKPWTLRRPAGEITVRADPPVGGTATFIGAVGQGDGWRRLAQAVRGKVRQTAGSASAWIRVDALDGFFQFTDWRGHSWSDRLNLVEAALRETIGDASHIAGVVISSGLATSPGAIDSSAEDITVTSAAGVGLRRLVAPHWCVRHSSSRCSLRSISVSSCGLQAMQGSDPGWT